MSDCAARPTRRLQKGGIDSAIFPATRYLMREVVAVRVRDGSRDGWCGIVTGVPAARRRSHFLCRVMSLMTTIALERDGSPVTTFDHVPSPLAVVNVIAASSRESSSHTDALIDALRAEIPHLGPNVTESATATASASARRLSVLVSDGVAAFSSAPAGGVLPALPFEKRKEFNSMFPEAVRSVNAALWPVSPADIVPAVLAAVGATPSPRAFISYRRDESSAVAVQLFDAMSHAGFDVFLDQFRVSPGADFQAMLTEQMGDMAMVVVLETKTILEREWTKYEINLARSSRMAACAIQFSDGPAVPDLDDTRRLKIGTAIKETTKLDDGKIAEIVAFIRRQHDRGMARRRSVINGLIANALQNAGVPYTIEDSGVIRVTQGDGYIVWSSLRAPALVDFHTAHTLRQDPARGVVVGLSELYAAERAAQIKWLSGVSAIVFVDEGKVADAAKRMADGTLQ